MDCTREPPGRSLFTSLLHRCHPSAAAAASPYTHGDSIPSSGFGSYMSARLTRLKALEAYEQDCYEEFHRLLCPFNNSHSYKTQLSHDCHHAPCLLIHHFARCYHHFTCLTITCPGRSHPNEPCYACLTVPVLANFCSSGDCLDGFFPTKSLELLRNTRYLNVGLLSFP